MAEWSSIVERLNFYKQINDDFKITMVIRTLIIALLLDPIAWGQSRPPGNVIDLRDKRDLCEVLRIYTRMSRGEGFGSRHEVFRPAATTRITARMILSLERAGVDLGPYHYVIYRFFEKLQGGSNSGYHRFNGRREYFINCKEGDDFSNMFYAYFPLVFSYFEGVNFQGSILYGTQFQRTTLNGADLSFANLQYANFQDSSLMGANLEGAEVYCADFSGAHLRSAKISNLTSFCTSILFDMNTHFPLASYGVDACTFSMLDHIRKREQCHDDDAVEAYSRALQRSFSRRYRNRHEFEFPPELEGWGEELIPEGVEAVLAAIVLITPIILDAMRRSPGLRAPAGGLRSR